MGQESAIWKVWSRPLHNKFSAQRKKEKKKSTVPWTWDVQHDIIAFNSYLSYWSHCYICKFNAVCFSYYLDDSQATNCMNINVDNIYVCERACRTSDLGKFRIYVLPLRSPTKIPFLSMFDLICKIWHVCLLPGPDLGEGRVGSCPGAPTKRGPHKFLLYLLKIIVHNENYKVNS